MNLDVITIGADTYLRVGDRLGSNPGGWYRRQGAPARDDSYYIKLYANPDNARMECLANSIYRKLGINVPVTELLQADQGLFVASKKIGEALRATREEQQADQELKRGFVADCYLNNWDVVGEFFDNIVKDEHGRLYRVDNGGCGPLRASGKRRAFPPASIDELTDMRNPKFQAGQIFADIADRDVIQQARHLVETLDDGFMEAAVRSAALSDDVAGISLAGFLGRKKVLAEVAERGSLLWHA